MRVYRYEAKCVPVSILIVQNTSWPLTANGIASSLWSGSSESLTGNSSTSGDPLRQKLTPGSQSTNATKSRLPTDSFVPIHMHLHCPSGLTDEDTTLTPTFSTMASPPIPPFSEFPAPKETQHVEDLILQDDRPGLERFLHGMPDPWKWSEYRSGDIYPPLWNAIRLASKSESLSVFKLLLAQDIPVQLAEPTYDHGPVHLRALHEACASGQPEVVRFLMEESRGQPTDVQTMVGTYRRTALTRAVDRRMFPWTDGPVAAAARGRRRRPQQDGPAAVAPGRRLSPPRPSPPRPHADPGGQRLRRAPPRPPPPASRPGKPWRPPEAKPTEPSGPARGNGRKTISTRPSSRNTARSSRGSPPRSGKFSNRT